MSATLESVTCSRNAGQQVRCFDRCQFIITWMQNIKEVHSVILCDAVVRVHAH